MGAAMTGPVEVEHQDHIVFARATCDLDLVNADAVRDGCLAATTNDCIGLVLDLSRTEYLDSAGIRALFTIANRLRPHRQRLALVVPPESQIRRVLALVDIESSVSVDETTDMAVMRLRAPG